MTRFVLKALRSSEVSFGLKIIQKPAESALTGSLLRQCFKNPAQGGTNESLKLSPNEAIFMSSSQNVTALKIYILKDDSLINTAKMKPRTLYINAMETNDLRTSNIRIELLVF